MVPNLAVLAYVSTQPWHVPYWCSRTGLFSCAGVNLDDYINCSFFLYVSVVNFVVCALLFWIFVILCPLICNFKGALQAVFSSGELHARHSVAFCCAPPGPAEEKREMMWPYCGRCSCSVLPVASGVARFCLDGELLGGGERGRFVVVCPMLVLSFLPGRAHRPSTLGTGLGYPFTLADQWPWPCAVMWRCAMWFDANSDVNQRDDTSARPSLLPFPLLLFLRLFFRISAVSASSQARRTALWMAALMHLRVPGGTTRPGILSLCPLQCSQFMLLLQLQLL